MAPRQRVFETAAFQKAGRKQHLFSGEHGLYHLPVDIRQAEIATLEGKNQLLVVKAQQMKDSGMHIVDGRLSTQRKISDFI
ncbi:MAG: hypothetical protein RI973_2032, partial [Bacteroidota bacterium]